MRFCLSGASRVTETLIVRTGLPTVGYLVSLAGLFLHRAVVGQCNLVSVGPFRVAVTPWGPRNDQRSTPLMYPCHESPETERELRNPVHMLYIVDRASNQADVLILSPPLERGVFFSFGEDVSSGPM